MTVATCNARHLQCLLSFQSRALSRTLGPVKRSHIGPLHPRPPCPCIVRVHVSEAPSPPVRAVGIILTSLPPCCTALCEYTLYLLIQSPMIFNDDAHPHPAVTVVDSIQKAACDAFEGRLTCQAPPGQRSASSRSAAVRLWCVGSPLEPQPSSRCTGNR